MLKSNVTSENLASAIPRHSLINTNVRTLALAQAHNESSPLDNLRQLSIQENPPPKALVGGLHKKFPRLSLTRDRYYSTAGLGMNKSKESGMGWNRSLPETRNPLSMQGLRKADNFRLKFRRSHTCGSLFAKCNCALNTEARQLEKSALLVEEGSQQMLSGIEINECPKLDNLVGQTVATMANISMHAVTVHHPTQQSPTNAHLSKSPSANADLSGASIVSNSGKRSATSGFCSLSSQNSAATSAFLSRDDSLSASFDSTNTNTTIAVSVTKSHDSLNVTTADSSALKARTSFSLQKPALSTTTQISNNNSKLKVGRSDGAASPKKDITGRKLFTSYSHPDTNFIFTDSNKHAPRESISEDTKIVTRGGKIEIKQPKRSSSPNIGQYQVLDVAVHPDILVKISPKHSSVERNNNSAQQRRRLLRRSREIDSEGSTSESDKSVDAKSPQQQDILGKKDNLIGKNFTKVESNFQGAQKYFTESGILGPLQQTSTNLIRKTSKILQDSQVIEQIRKTSLILRSNNTMSSVVVKDRGDESGSQVPSSQQDSTDKVSTAPSRHISTQCGFSPNIITQSAIATDDKDTQIKSLLGEIVSLKDVIKSRDAEILKLRHEIHKLKQATQLDKLSKSVLQQTTPNQININNDENSRLSSSSNINQSTNHNHQSSSSNQLDRNFELQTSCKTNQDLPKMRTKSLNETNVNNKNFYGMDHEYRNNRSGSLDIPYNNTFEWNLNNTNRNRNSGNTIKNHHHHQQIVIKKHGVSGESWDASMQQNINLPIPKYEKDYRSKHLIKEAIMDNDFLKNIDAYQVKELVDSMYELCIESGQYVIREGDVGAHLYVSSEGEFEVIKNNQILGVIGPGKAFGELAILYNCTRTASVRVLSSGRVWVLDRRIFQQIMMRTGIQRIQKSVKFLKSVPLLKNLSDPLLTKIADVLEVEFYPAGTYIIRQGTKGDTFFLISQGSVKVTQKAPNTLTEKVLRVLERGDYFGERALINEEKRTANIIALPPGVECLTLDRDSFTDLIGNLSELKEKNYIDESLQVTFTRVSLSTGDAYKSNLKTEYKNLQLSDLEVVTTLGLGGFGRVELIKAHQGDREAVYALKCLKKCHIVETKQEEHVFNERNILMCCESPFICRMYRTFRDSKYVYMLMEPCMGGEVWTMLRDQGAFHESAAQFIIGCVLEAFEYLHARDIIYRDLKPENLMMNERGYVKLVDFGFAKLLSNSNKTWTFCGTPEYVAPEIILNKGHDRAVDYWALGILIHELLTGTPPFTANDPMKIYNFILKGIDMIDFPKYMSRASIQIIKRLCRDMPAERLGYQKGGIQTIKKHKWFLGFDWDGLINQSLSPPFKRPIAHSTDTCYFDKFPCDSIEPPDELSGWDANF